jgi:hypothetical protein
MAMSPIAIAPALLVEARRLYEETTVPVPDIAAMLGVSVSVFSRQTRRLGWRPRKRRHLWPAPEMTAAAASASSAASENAAASSAPPAHPHSPGERVQIAVRLQRAVERELAAMEKIVAQLGATSGHAGEAERAARTLASLARTLKEVMRLDLPPQPPADDESVPRDFDELRRALSEKLERLVAEQPGALPEDP